MLLKIVISYFNIITTLVRGHLEFPLLMYEISIEWGFIIADTRLGIKTARSKVNHSW